MQTPAKMRRRYAEFTSFLLCFFLINSVSAQLNLDQNSTMSKLYDLVTKNTPSSPWKNVKFAENPCSWFGVFCSSDNSSVTGLSLSNFYVSNLDILSVSCQIETLETLDLSNNHFGSVTDEFITVCGKLSGLKLLNVSRNNIVGSLPVFKGFVVLEYLDLSYNSLGGKFDSQLNELVGLKRLNLSDNSLSGSIPINLENLGKLEELQLGGNSFEGGIPVQMANCGNLTLIDLTDNKLSGSIPDRFGELVKLDSLFLSRNNLTGEIPKSLLNITTLSRFAAHQNNLVGGIPVGMTRQLKSFDLSFNKLNGPIPVELLSTSNLETVDLSNNRLEGSIPVNMSSSLIRLRLGNNSLNGMIPSSFGKLSKLTYLELEDNKLIGPVPPELGLCRHLALLNLCNNNLSGTLPDQLGKLADLQGLYLQHNNLSGAIPDQITELSNLQRLNLSQNAFTGQIPSSISNLTNLTNLCLQENFLNGSIPDTISSLNKLIELQLGSNRLSGTIRSVPKNLQISLNLSSNKFEGEIPEVLSRLFVLEVLDLSNNSFSGEIPDSLTNLGSLTRLILSNNQLSGVIPEFKPYVTLDINGNKHLINITTPSLPVPKSKRKVSAAVVIAAAAGVLAVAILLVIALYISRRYYSVKNVHSNSVEDVPQPQVIKGKMLTANAIHRSNIDFTSAMNAVANFSNILVKTRFSTYYKCVMPSGKHYFVKKLNWSDKIFQMGNHEKFGEELEVLGKLNNSNVMSPLAYVLTIDSAYLFYEFAEDGTLFDFLHNNLGNALEWSSRYSIALGVAQGLAFLHGYTSGPILLLDLSSRSIMLKSSKEPQIGDIELYKVFDPTKSTGSLSTIAGSVGYIPPEYAYTMRITMAANVYSFGVILLELLSGKPAVSAGTELAKWALSKSAQQDKWDHILDFRMSRASPAIKSQMLAILKVALSCVSVSPEARPKMKSVLRLLLNAR